MYEVITVGSNTVDVFANTDLKEIQQKNKKYIAYPVGSKILIKNTEFTTGGGGTNTAVSFAKLGLKTGYLGKISKDYFGKLVLEELKKEKIDFLGVIKDKKNSFSLILDSKENNRAILVYKGISSDLKFKEINKNKIKTKWFYLTSQLRESFETQKKLLKYAKKNNIKIAFNPSEYLIKKKDLKPLLKNIDILILNNEEAKLLTKKRNLLKGLYELGPKIVCITNSKKEILLYDGYYKYKLQPHKIKVKERTGAGDAFASTLVGAIIKKESVENALKMALINSESVIRYYGAKQKLLTWKQIKHRIKKERFNLQKTRLK